VAGVHECRGGVAYGEVLLVFGGDEEDFYRHGYSSGVLGWGIRIVEGVSNRTPAEKFFNGDCDP
jgi:hypothetical protein